MNQRERETVTATQGNRGPVCEQVYESELCIYAQFTVAYL